MESNGMGLVGLCIEAASKDRESIEKWRRQRRTLERLPSQLGDALFRCLARRRLLFPSLLEVFQHCVEDVDLNSEVYVDAEWMAYLGAFRYLRKLNLADCRAINDAALWPITGMTTLKELDLSRCLKITDAGIEHVLSNSNLEKLNVSETKLTSAGVMRFKSLRHLRVLDLGGLPVTDEALCSLQMLTQLENLDLWGSKISNEGAFVLKLFPKLSILNLAWTNVSKVPDLSSVSCLNMSNCTIFSIFDEKSTRGAPLGKLLVSGATFSNLDEAFSCLPTSMLSFLDLSKSSVCNFQFLVNMKGLEYLNLSSSRITDDLIGPVTCIGEKLRDLNLSSTKFTSQGIANLSGHVPNLQTLCLSHTSVDDLALPYIGMMPSLKVVDLSNTNVKGFTYWGENNMEKTFSLIALQNLNGLESLNLEETHVGDETLHPLAAMEGLKSLALKGDFISDVSLHVMSNLPNLKHLGFRGTVLTNSGLNLFKPPEMLQVLDLRGCWLLTANELILFCKSYPWIKVKHELGPMPSDDHVIPVFSSSSHVKNRASQLRSSRGKLPQLPAYPKDKFVDERIKYNKEELLDLQFSPLSHIARDILCIELPQMLIKD